MGILELLHLRSPCEQCPGCSHALRYLVFCVVALLVCVERSRGAALRFICACVLCPCVCRCTRLGRESIVCVRVRCALHALSCAPWALIRNQTDPGQTQQISEFPQIPASAAHLHHLWFQLHPWALIRNQADPGQTLQISESPQIPVPSAHLHQFRFQRLNSVFLLTAGGVFRPKARYPKSSGIFSTPLQFCRPCRFKTGTTRGASWLSAARSGECGRHRILPRLMYLRFLIQNRSR